MRTIRNVLIVLIAIVAVVIIGVALTCNGNGSGDDDGDSTQTPPAGTPVAGGEEFEVTVDDIVTIIRQGQGAELRGHLSSSLLEQVDDAQLDALASCVPQGVTLTVVDRNLEELANDASATIEFEVTNAAGETSDVTGVWNFERSGDSWLLKELPPCPVEGP
jgi:hypothetical protein